MNKSPSALFVTGGYAPHQPEKIAAYFSQALQKYDFKITIESSLEIYADAERLQEYSVISPCWTMGTLSPEQAKGLIGAVRSGVGLAGLHGGMGDAFRGQTEYEWMVGGHFVGHPHVGDYTVNLRSISSPITAGLPTSFPYRSEQYYLLVDPAVEVLADSLYIHEGRACTMPITWVKNWGKGRVYYNALGHSPEEFTQFPVAHELALRGMLWAAGIL